MQSFTPRSLSVKPKKPLQPAKIDWCWVWRSSVPGPRLGVVEIHGIHYAVTLIEGGIELRKSDDEGTVYHICTSEPWGWTCDCADAEFRPGRPGGCKHIVNVFQAFLAINLILYPKSKPQPPAETPEQVRQGWRLLSELDDL